LQQGGKNERIWILRVKILLFHEEKEEEIEKIFTQTCHGAVNYPTGNRDMGMQPKALPDLSGLP
jgi:hypothetical protein